MVEDLIEIGCNKALQIGRAQVSKIAKIFVVQLEAYIAGLHFLFADGYSDDARGTRARCKGHKPQGRSLVQISIGQVN
jgi:hypothetical protein